MQVRVVAAQEERVEHLRIVGVDGTDAAAV
jgi:hypothetical protein